MNANSVEFHATKQLMLDTVLRLFETENPAAITSEQVLTKARVSSGSLYHHFEDFSDLVEQALCIEYEKFPNRTIDLLNMANEQAGTLTEWAEGVQAARRISHGPAYARNRALRVWAIAFSTNSQRMKTRTGQAQDRLNQKFVKFADEAKRVGWVIPEVDSLTVSVFIQAYSFGAVIDDVATIQVDQSTWMELLDGMIRKSFVRLP